MTKTRLCCYNTLKENIDMLDELKEEFKVIREKLDGLRGYL